MMLELDPEINPEPVGVYQLCGCGEPIISMDKFNWVHEHGDVECWTGDGSVACPYDIG
jgi:hypothetical protein